MTYMRPLAAQGQQPRALLVLAAAVMGCLVGCGQEVSETHWSLVGPGLPPAGLGPVFATAANYHLRRIGIMGGTRAEADASGWHGTVEYSGVPVEAVEHAFAYALDTLDAKTATAARSWTVVLTYPDGRPPVRLEMTGR